MAAHGIHQSITAHFPAVQMSNRTGPKDRTVVLPTVSPSNDLSREVKKEVKSRQIKNRPAPLLHLPEIAMKPPPREALSQFDMFLRMEKTRQPQKRSPLKRPRLRRHHVAIPPLKGRDHERSKEGDKITKQAGLDYVTTLLNGMPEGAIKGIRCKIRFQKGYHSSLLPQGKTN
jgi:hypothetical protein